MIILMSLILSFFMTPVFAEPLTLIDEAYGERNYPPDAGSLAADSRGHLYYAGTRGQINGSWVIKKSEDGGRTWRILDGSAGGDFAYQVRVDKNDHVYVMGTGRQHPKDRRPQPFRTQIKRSKDFGATWEVIDNFYLESSDVYAMGNEVNDVAVDAAGTIYAVGASETSSVSLPYVYYHHHWLVRKSVDGGKTWSVEDKFFIGDRKFAKAFARRVLIDRDGNVYVAGVAEVPRDGSHLIVRMKKKGERGWKTVDDFKAGGHPGFPDYQALVSDRENRIYVLGSYFRGGNRPNEFFIRATSDGKSWKMIQDMTKGSASDLFIDRQGHFYLALDFVVEGEKGHWEIRRSADSCKSWNVVDRFIGGADHQTYPRAITQGLDGSIYIAGESFPLRVTVPGRWIVRKIQVN